MAKRGRKGKYDTNIKPHLEQIRKWKAMGATDKQIYEALDINRNSFYKYLNENAEFRESLKKGKSNFVVELKGRLASLTEKRTLETKKQYIKEDQETGAKVAYTEITTREVDPDLGAIHLLLKNLDRENWADNPQSISLKQQELDLRKAIAENQSFDGLNLDEDKKK